MVVLNTKSQLDNFVKRMKDKYEHHVVMDWGAYCYGTSIVIDQVRKRVLMHKYSDAWDDTNSCTVLATFKKIR